MVVQLDKVGQSHDETWLGCIMNWQACADELRRKRVDTKGGPNQPLQPDVISRNSYLCFCENE